MHTKRLICAIDPANDSSLRIRVLLALHTSGQECLQTPEQMQKKLSEKHGQKFSLFEIEQTLLPCPKCGATRAPMVGMLAKTHLLLRDKKGNFEGASGLRYRIGCDPENKRTVISTTENHELATGDRQIANCIDCLAQADKHNVGWQTGSLIKPQPNQDWN